MDYDYTLNKMLSIKEAVAKNPNVTQEALGALSSDDDEHVWASAASNPRIVPQLLAKLSEDVSWLVRDRIANNEATPESQACLPLLADRIMDVRISVARTPRRLRRHCPP